MSKKVERGRSYKHAKSAGKGSAPRHVDPEKYGKNFDAIFGKKKVGSGKTKKVYSSAKDHVWNLNWVDITKPSTEMVDAVNWVTRALMRRGTWRPTNRRRTTKDEKTR
jgi:hypothetical protein